VDITIRQNSLKVIALIVVAAASLWLVGVAFLMALRPRYCLHLFEKMSTDLLERSNWRLQFTEQGLRVLASISTVRTSLTEINGW
jgi:hypothetical protein